MRILLHTGKGGVGKTSLSLATELACAEHGHRVFVLSTDSAHSLGDALGRRVGAEPTEIAPGVVAQEVEVLAELDRAWRDIREWLRELLREDTDGLLADELLVFPGLEELIALRAVNDVASSGKFDVCVVDCAPTGSTLRLLRFPDALRVFMEHLFDFERKGVRLLRPLVQRLGSGRLLPREAFFDALERLYKDVESVRQMLLDTDRTTARLVLNPSRVVVAETRRSFAYLSLYGVSTDAVLVNRVLPDLAQTGFMARWADREERVLGEIEESFPVPVFRVPLAQREPIGAEVLRQMGESLFDGRDPAEHFSRQSPIQIKNVEGRVALQIDLPGALLEEVKVSRIGDEVLLRVRDATRRLALPASVVGRALEQTRLQDGVLTLFFGA
ncbi:MAG: TRC40/GET3/ArsA family transport-energizing ATPase [Myxococcota bacterium]|nr:TRC40/GET3/ArsA family transport-energizing ATPase [Myxococcota bacterium]